MRLYQISFVAADTQARSYAWCGSQSEASAKRAELRKTHGHTNVTDTTEIDVPTKKPELLAFLNERTGSL